MSDDAEQIRMSWYPNGTPDVMTGYGSINGRMTLADIAAWCSANGVDPDTVTINGNIRTRRPYTSEETEARVRRIAASKERSRDWEIRTLHRLAEEYPDEPIRGRLVKADDNVVGESW